jgi:Carboxypeptidase regulatory-like domain/TonB dependent receptor
MRKRIARILIIFSLTVVSAFAQTETGRIIGTLTDTSGAVIPGATVTLTHVQTNRETVATTDDTGRYVSIPLAIGNYRVAVERAGFKKVIRSGITLQVGETAVLDFKLEVGELTQQVEVTSDAPLLETTEASQGQVIDSRRIVDLPLNGRDYLDLALVSAGTLQASGAFGGFSANGLRNTQNNYMLDGLDNNNNQLWAAAGRGEAVKPSVDGVQEFKVLTNNYSAEYGRAAGGIVNVAIKSGTNAFHGTAFEFIRNEALDARNFFAPPNENKPPFKRNQFGFSLGGPVIKDKTFFFGDYEGTRIRESSIYNNTIPTLKIRQGDFSELSQTIYDPTTYDPATNTRRPFPGNIIPDNRIDPVARKLTELYPDPTNNQLSENFLWVTPNRQNANKFDIRIDHNLASRDTIYYRHSYYRTSHPSSPSMPPPLYGGFGAQKNQHDGWNAGLVWNHTFSPTLITSTRGAYNKVFSRIEPPVDKNLNAELGINGVNQDAPGFATFGISGYSEIGLGPWLPTFLGSRNRQLKNDTSWIKGKHTLKFGVDILSKGDNQHEAEFAPGAFSFDGVFTRDPETGLGGDGFADFLLGIPNTSNAGTFLGYSSKSWLDQFYVQDDWQVTPELTLNLGWRYELFQFPYELHNNIANFDIDTDPSNPQLVLAKNGSHSDRSTVASDTNNFAPRFGFAYKFARRTVLRGGYGIFYANNEGAGDSQWLQGNPPFAMTVNLTTDTINPVVLLKNGVPEGTVSLTNLHDVRPSSYERHPSLGYSQQWNFNIQRELAPDWLWEIGYYGNKANHLLQRWDANYALAGPGDLNARRRWRSVLIPGTDIVVSPLSALEAHRFDGNSLFHSLQTRIEKRFSAGFTLLASYNWSKTISDVCQPGNGTGCQGSNIQNPLDRRAERSVDDQHIGHRLVGSYVWSLPFGQGHRWGKGWSSLTDTVLGGWNVSGILTLTSGLPFSLSVAGNPSNSSGHDRPDLVGDLRVSDRTIDRWFNTDAFAPNAPFTYGNVGRNSLTGPPLRNLDFAALKNFRVNERVALQFRFEAFNFTNTPPFGIPGSTVGTRSFGRITSAGRPRNLQFGLKAIF